MSIDAHQDSIAGAIRVAARALIIEDGKLLVIKYRDEKGSWCCTPGGGIEKHETLGAGLRREIHEELGINIFSDDIVYVRELMGSKAEVQHGGITDETHQLEIFFHCKREGEPALGEKPDGFCIGFDWAPLSDLASWNFFPKSLAKRLSEDVTVGFKPHNNYLGDA